MTYRYSGMGDVSLDMLTDVGVGKMKEDFEAHADIGEITKDTANTIGKTAAMVQGAATAAVACAATGVGVAVAPLCASVGAAVGKFLYEEIGPVFAEIGNFVGGLFGSDSDAQKEREKRAQEIRTLKLQFQMERIANRGTDLLWAIAKRLLWAHNALGLPGPYGWREMQANLQRYGLRLEPYIAPGGKTVTSWVDPYSKVQVTGVTEMTQPYWVEKWLGLQPQTHTYSATGCFNKPSAVCDAQAQQITAAYDDWIDDLNVAAALEMGRLSSEAVSRHVQHQMDLARRHAMTVREQFEAAQYRATHHA